MENLADILTPTDFIKLHFVLSGVLNNFSLKKISFKEKGKYDLVIANIVRILPMLKFKFGRYGTYVYLDKFISNYTSIIPFTTGADPNNFLLKCDVYLSGPNVASDTLFYGERHLIKVGENENTEIFEREFQKKFIEMLQTINSKYNTTYVFSFKFSKIYVMNNEKKINFSIGQNNQLICNSSEKSIKNVSEASSIMAPNKKRKISYAEDDDSDNE